MEIRIAREQDLEGILRLLVQVNQVHANLRPDLFKGGGVKYTLESLKEKLQVENERIYVAVEDDCVLGYVFTVIEDQEESSNRHARRAVYIDDFCVDEECRGKQIGTKLFQFVKQEASVMGAYHITLHVWNCNPWAERFYRSLGMQPMYTAMELVLDPRS
ncbi:MAG: GNAT family N-acetyltransferase [Lachnospiraceae bacterium]|nr:GNAT family N-acetyltransferase [Lachnospiraceae bacterium]